MKKIRPFPVFAFLSVLSMFSHATGVQPDSTIVLLSAAEGQAQMVVKNTEAVPLLMNVVVQDLPGSEAITVLPLPQVSRVEPNGHQVVRFAMTKSANDITKQYLKRVSFEGIPPATNGPDKAVVNFNVRQTIPMVISPKGLEQDPEPWKKLKIAYDSKSNSLALTNDSPFVVRLNSSAELLPSKSPLLLLKDTYVLPGDKIISSLPDSVKGATIKAVKIFPASPWGFAVDPYEIQISHSTN